MLRNYRCVPKIASPEARKYCHRKNACPNILVYLKSPRRRREKAKVLQRNTNVVTSTLWGGVLSRHRCVPKIASPEARKNLNTTNLQRHRSQNPGSEPSVGRVYCGPI